MESDRSEIADDVVRNARRLCELMDEQIRSRTLQERDRLVQQFIAEAMTPAERFRTLCVLMDHAIAQNRARRGQERG